MAAPHVELSPRGEGWSLLGIRADNPGPMTLTGTNSYVVLAGERRIVIDPGPELPEHLASLLAHGAPSDIVLTHHHDDHAAAVRAGWAPSARVWAADPALRRGTSGLPERVGPLGLRATPGHTGDSICLLIGGHEGAPAALLTGDTVLGEGTTVIAHPDGVLADYLDSLAWLRGAVGPRTLLLPGHGPVVSDAADRVDAYLRHRAERLDQVRALRAAGTLAVDDLVEALYRPDNATIRRAAAASVRAQVTYLESLDSTAQAGASGPAPAAGGTP